MNCELLSLFISLSLFYIIRRHDTHTPSSTQDAHDKQQTANRAKQCCWLATRRLLAHNATTQTIRACSRDFYSFFFIHTRYGIEAGQDQDRSHIQTIQSHNTLMHAQRATPPDAIGQAATRTLHTTTTTPITTGNERLHTISTTAFTISVYIQGTTFPHPVPFL